MTMPELIMLGIIFGLLIIIHGLSRWVVTMYKQVKSDAKTISQQNCTIYMQNMLIEKLGKDAKKK
jgi:hypothetical protein